MEFSKQIYFYYTTASIHCTEDQYQKTFFYATIH